MRRSVVSPRHQPTAIAQAAPAVARSRPSLAFVLVAATAALTMLAASVRPAAAQDASRDSLTALPVLLMRAVPDGLGAQASSPTDRVGRTRWEHGTLTMSNGGNRYRWAGPDTALVEASNPLQFLLQLGADPYTRLRPNRRQDEVQASILGLLGQQYWELVSCQYIRNDLGDNMTICYLKRPVETAP
jgi:hypothetical protein